MNQPAEATVDRYAVMGFPVQHSWSPFIHGMFARQTGQSLSYTRIEATPEMFADAVARFFGGGGKGLNVTIPHKRAAMQLIRHCTPRASIAGAINTIAVEEQGLLGDNTDGAGLINDLTRNLGVKLQGKRILLLGAGGAARGVLGPLLESNPGRLELANRTLARALELKEQFEALGEIHPRAFDEITPHPFDLIINATSASLQQVELPIHSMVIGRETLCYDMAYSREDTAFVQWAKKKGAERAESGWGMLVEQAAEAFELWRGIRPDTQPVLDALKSPPPSHRATV